MNKDWLKELKPGDTVIVCGRSNRQITTIERITKTQIILKRCAEKYNRKSGYLVGRGPWDCSNLIEATNELLIEIRANIKRRKMEDVLGNIKWKDVDIKKIEKILAILEDSN